MQPDPPDPGYGGRSDSPFSCPDLVMPDGEWHRTVDIWNAAA